jgi:hypothetical protein
VATRVRRRRQADDGFGGTTTDDVDDSAENKKREDEKEKDLARDTDRRNRKPDTKTENPGQPDGWATSRRRRRRSADEFPMDTVDRAEIANELEKIEDEKEKDLVEDTDRRNREPDNSTENPGQPDGWATKGSAVRAQVIASPTLVGARVLLGRPPEVHEGRVVRVFASTFDVKWEDGEGTRESKANFQLLGAGSEVPCNYCNETVGAGQLREHYKTCPAKPLTEAGARAIVRRIELASRSRRGRSLHAYVSPDNNTGLIVVLESGKVAQSMATTAADTMTRLEIQRQRGYEVVADARFRVAPGVWARNPRRAYHSLERQVAAVRRSSVVEDVRAAYNESTRNLNARFPLVTDVAEFRQVAYAIGEYNNFDPERVASGLAKIWGTHVSGVEPAREGSPALYIHGDTNIISLVAPGLGADEVQIQSDSVVRCWWD